MQGLFLRSLPLIAMAIAIPLHSDCPSCTIRTASHRDNLNEVGYYEDSAYFNSNIRKQSNETAMLDTTPSLKESDETEAKESSETKDKEVKDSSEEKIADLDNLRSKQKEKREKRKEKRAERRKERLEHRKEWRAQHQKVTPTTPVKPTTTSSIPTPTHTGY